MNARVDAVLRLIHETPTIPRAEIASRLGITEAQVRTALDILKRSGTIHREGSDKGGRWVID